MMTMGVEMMPGIVRDLHFGLRSLRKSPLVTSVCVLTLALGIGSAMTMFSLVEGVLLDQPPVHEAQRIAMVWSANAQRGVDRGLASEADFLDWRAQTTTFEQLAAFAEAEKWVKGFGEPHRLSTQMVTADFFRLFGVAPESGRSFDRADERPGAPRSAILSHNVWQKYFRASPAVIGQDIQLDGLSYTVIGVLPQDFWYPRRGAEIWTAVTLDPSANRASRSLRVIGRLKNGATVEQAGQEMSAIARSLELRFPATDYGWGARVVTVKSEQNKKTGLLLAFGMGPVVLLLLIACINVTNLLLARGFSRQVEFATRAALGASRARLVQQQLIENFLLAISGGLAGTVMAYLGMAFLRSAFRPVNSALASGIRANEPVLVFGSVVTVLLPLLFAIVPALRAVQGNPGEMLKQAGSGGSTRITLRRLPVAVLEIAMAMILLVLTGLFSRALINVERGAAPGIDAASLVRFTLRPTGQAQHVDRLLSDLALLPGVSSVGMTDQLPVLSSRTEMRPLWIDRDGAPAQIPSLALQADKGFFQVLQLRQLQGQPISDAEVEGAIVSDAFARRYAGNVLGARIRKADGPGLAVTAVVSDWVRDVRSGEPLPTVYFPISKPAGPVQIVVRTGRGPALIPTLKRTVRSWDREQPMEDFETVAQTIEKNLAESKLVIHAIGTFAFLAVLLACVGVYSVMNYSISRRTRELGIRMALGATRARLFALVVREGLLLTTVGLGSGWLLGVAGARIIAHELVGTTPADPATALSCSFVILITGLGASCLPARRAACVDPMVAVRSE